MDEQQTLETDTGLEELFTEDDQSVGSEDVEKVSDQLSLDELSKTLGREIKTKEEATKALQNLKSFAGDQEAIKERKAQKELEKKAEEEKTLREEIEQIKKESAKKDFLLETPTAKQHVSILEAYAEKNGLSLGEAWNSEAFKPIAEASMRASKTVVTNNRITPVQAQTVNKLAEQVKETGSDDAKVALVKEYLK